MMMMMMNKTWYLWEIIELLFFKKLFGEYLSTRDKEYYFTCVRLCSAVVCTTFQFFITIMTCNCPVSWRVNIPTVSYHPPKECPGYDTKQSNGEVPVMLRLWGMRSTPLSPLLPGPLWLGSVAPDRALSIGYIELNCILTLN